MKKKNQPTLIKYYCHIYWPTKQEQVWQGLAGNFPKEGGEGEVALGGQRPTLKPKIQ
jgi:hypothetical protein